MILLCYVHGRNTYRIHFGNTRMHGATIKKSSKCLKEEDGTDGTLGRRATKM
jgi:hypothetical protein